MSSKAVIGIIVAVIVVGGFFLVYNNRSYSPSYQPQSSPPTSTQTSQQPTTEQNVITLTPAGFSPSTLTVKAGTKVTWVNQSSKQAAVGVDPHPVHTGDRAITNGEFTLNLSSGESKTVTVDKTGEFGYHNHLNPSQTGTIIVQ